MLALDQRDEALESIAPRALAIAESIGDRGRAFRACRLALDSLIGIFSDRDRNLFWLDKTERYIGDDLRAKLRLLRAKAGFRIQSGFDLEARPYLVEAMQLTEELGDDNEFVGVAWLRLNGLLERAEIDELFEQGYRRLQGDISGGNRYLFLLYSAASYLALGDREMANRIAAEGFAFAESSRLIRAQASARYLEANFAALDGNLQVLEPSRALDWANSLSLRSASWLGAISDYPASDPGPESSFAPQVLAAVALKLKGEESASTALFSRLRQRLDDSDHPVSPRNAAFLMELGVLLSDESTVSRTYELLASLKSDRLFYLQNPITPCVPLLLSKAAKLLGNYETARAQCEDAVKACERLGDRPEMALCRLHLAELLLDHYPDERDAAIEHLDFAIAEFQDMKMQPALERALRHRGLLKA
jgi:hypothetical protein